MIGTNEPDRGMDRRQWKWFWAVLALAFVIRTIDMFVHPFGPDEGWTMELTTGSWGDLFRKTAEDTHPPFHYVLVKLWFSLVGEGFFRAKFLSIPFDVAALGLMFFLARRWFGGRAAWIALGFAVAAPYMIYWSHVARNHMLQPLFIMMVLLGSYRFLESGCRASWGMVAVGWTLAIQNNYMAFPIGLVWGVAMLFAVGGWRRKGVLALAGVPGLLLFLPWLAVMRAHMEESPMTIPFFQEFISPFSLYYHGIFGSMTHLQGAKSGFFYWVSVLFFVMVLSRGFTLVGRRWDIWILIVGLSGLPILLAWMKEYTLAERHLRYSLFVFFPWWGGCIDRWISVFCEWRRGRKRLE